MGKFICRCGQQIRTTAKPGAKIECPRCQSELKVAEKVLVLGDSSDIPLLGTRELRRSDPNDPSPEIYPVGRTTQSSVGSNLSKRPSYLGLAIAVFFLIASLGMIALVLQTNYKESDREPQSQQQPASQPSVAETRWSNLQWEKDLSALANSPQIKSLAEKIATTGSTVDPTKFWELLDSKAFEQRVFSPLGSLRAYQDKVPIEKIIDKLKGFPIDALSTPQNTAASNWQVIGFQTKGQSIGVLVRYFHEPLNLQELVSSTQWIETLKNRMGVEEYLNVAKDLYSTRNPNSNQQSDKDVDLQSIFTPHLGYLVLVFEPTSDQWNWCDTVGIPSEVSLSRASGTIFEEGWIAFRNQTEVVSKKIPTGWTPEGTIDAFGEYDSVDQESFAKSLLFAQKRPDAQTNLRLERESKDISPERTRLLIDVAHAVTSNYTQIQKRANLFRSNFPNDSGVDVLLLSLWLRFFNSEKSGMVFDDFGAVFVDAAERLHIKTGDKLLLEIKSRIYASHGRFEESNKQLEQAEQAGIRTAFLFNRRIEQAIEQNDKVQLMKHLSQFSSFWLGQPDVLLKADYKLISRKLSRMWQEEPSKKSKTN